MKNLLVLKTNDEWKEMVREYKETGSAESFYALYKDLKPMTDQLGKKWYYSYINLGVALKDYISVAEFAIYSALNAYDLEIGSSFPALLKQAVNWAIQDEIVRPADFSNNTLNTDAKYLDTVLEHGETLLDAIEHEFALSEEDVYGDVVNSDNYEGDVVLVAARLVADFTTQSSKDDSTIVESVINSILSIEKVSPADINHQLSLLFPEVKTPTIRKKKQRALARFTDFAHKKGFNQLNLSQF